MTTRERVAFMRILAVSVTTPRSGSVGQSRETIPGGYSPILVAPPACLTTTLAWICRILTAALPLEPGVNTQRLHKVTVAADR